MNQNTDNGGNGPDGGGADALALLIRAAGRRQPPPEAAYRQVYAATHGVWQRRVRRRAYWRAANAIAAGVAVVAVLIGIATLRAPEQPAPLPVASVDVVVGGATVLADAQSGWIALAERGATLAAGSRLRTDRDGGAGLLMAHGVSLRLDASTDILFETADRVRLLTGAVYVDSGPDPVPESALEIVTDAGVFRDIGTQFEVRRLGQVTRLRVREGLVRLHRPSGDVEAVAGDELALQPDGGVSRAHVSARDPGWRWVQAVASAPYTADQSLSELLEWVSRETGRAVRFADPMDSVAARRTTLHGSHQRLLPMEALTVMLATTDFEFAVTPDGDILLSAAR